MPTQEASFPLLLQICVQTQEGAEMPVLDLWLNQGIPDAQWAAGLICLYSHLD